MKFIISNASIRSNAFCLVEPMLISSASMAEDLDLTPEQRADAARLMETFLKWKADERARGRRATQESVAHALGFSQSAFSQFCRGVRPINADLLSKAHKLFGWDPASISPTLARKMAEFASAAGLEDQEEHVPVRLIDAKASAGKGQIVYSDDVSKDLMFRRDWLTRKGAKPSETLAFPVDGDSMVDKHIIGGSVVLANTMKRDPASKRIYVMWIDGQLYVKQLIKRDGLWFARSHNAAKTKDYPDIQIELDDRLVGQVFWCGFEV